MLEAASSGVDIFRIFDAFNDVEQMRPAIEAVLETGKVAEGTLCYSGDLANPGETTLHPRLLPSHSPSNSSSAAVHVLCVKDMAGCFAPPPRRSWSVPFGAASTCRCTCTPTTRPVVSWRRTWPLSRPASTRSTARRAPLAGTTSQPSLAAIVAATDHTERATGISLDVLNDLEPYWEAVRSTYAPFESGIPAPTGRVYRHEIPGGQLSNLRTQAIALGLGDRFDVVEDLYAAADRILGRLVKVTPTSKVVGDLALYLCGVNADPGAFERNPEAFDIPDSVIGFLEGQLGTPPGGWPEPFRTKALAARRPTPHVSALTSEDEAALSRPGDVRATLNRLLFPGPTAALSSALRTFGDLSSVPTRPFFYGLVHGEETEVSIGPGVSLFLTIDAVGELDEAGYRIAYCRLNGQYRALSIRDRSAEDRSPHREKALANDPTQVASPFAGVVITRVSAGDRVSVGQTVATIEAMKMEAAITAGVAGVVGRVAVESVANVEGGDLLLTIEPRAG